MAYDVLLLVKKTKSLFGFLTVFRFAFIKSVALSIYRFATALYFRFELMYSVCLQTVAEIKFYGGKAVPNFDSVEYGHKIVETAITHFGRIGNLALYRV